MLSVSEFTVGAFKDASPGSLVLPRMDREKPCAGRASPRRPCGALPFAPHLWTYFLTSTPTAGMGQTSRLR